MPATRTALVATSTLVAGIVLGLYVGRATVPHPEPPAADAASDPTPPSPSTDALAPPASPPISASSGRELPAWARAAEATRIARHEGRYALESDTEGMATWLRESAIRGARQNVDLRREAYQELFDSIGLDTETKEQLLHHLGKIFQAKIQAGRAHGEWDRALAAYDQRLRELAGDGYTAYREFEDGYIADRELTQISASFEQSGASLNAEESDLLLGLIQQHSAYTGRALNTHGSPYEPVLQPTSGERFEREAVHRLAETERLAATVLQSARDSGASEAVLAGLERYYAAQIAEAERTLYTARNPVGTMVDRLEERLLRLRNTPGADPDEIARLQRTVEQMRRIPQP